MSTTENDLSLIYVPRFYDLNAANSILEELLQYDYQPLHLCFRGKNFTPRRKVLAFGEPGLSYSFCGAEILAQEWTPSLLKVKKDVEALTMQEYNYVLINYYADGLAKISPHKDNEKELEPSATIPTLSLGVTRTMSFTRKDFNPYPATLEHGSLLLMQAPTNQFWSHEILADPEIKEARISLTFRKIEKVTKKRKAALMSLDGEQSTPSGTDETSRRKISTPLHKWHLGFGLVASIHQLDYRLFVHIRYFDEEDKPTADGIIMNIPTFRDFVKKIFHVNVKRENSSTICNNQLAIFSTQGELILKQIYHFEDYKFKENSLKIDYNYLLKLREIIPEMCEVIKQSLFNVVLPSKILENSERKPTSVIDINFELLDVLSKELKSNVYQIFPCSACDIGDFSQFNHSCMMDSYEDLLLSVGEDALLFTNVKRVIDMLRERNVLHYFNEEFFKTFTYDTEMKEYIMKM